MKTILITFCLLSFNLFAQDFIQENGKAVPTFLGQIKLFKGKVFKKNDKGTLPIKHGERFHQNDVLITEEQSLAKIMMIDDTIISIGPKSEFVIDSYEFNDKKDRKFAYSLLKGQITGHVKNKAKEGDIQFKTKYTSLGVRGTYIMMNSHQIGQMDIAEYALLSGEVEITNEKNQKFLLTKGEKMHFIHDEKQSMEEKLPLTPVEFKAYQADELDEEKAFKPFLPYLTPETVKKDSALYSMMTNAGTNSDNNLSSETKSVKHVSTTKKPHWKENLKKLNEKLKENRKK